MYLHHGDRSTASCISQKDTENQSSKKAITLLSQPFFKLINIPTRLIVRKKRVKLYLVHIIQRHESEHQEDSFGYIWNSKMKHASAVYVAYQHI